MYKSYPKTQFIGQKIIYLPTCHSTNDLAAESLRAEAPEGTLYVTDEQTAGRGQRGNTWKANAGENLTFSFIVYPIFLKATEQFRLSIAISLGIHDFLTELLYDHVFLKWPNDVYYKDQKLVGVLIENALMGSMLTGSVVGIGINVNQLLFPIDTATSIRQITGKEYSLEALLMQLCKCLEKRYLQLKNGGYSLQKMDYLKRLYRFEEWHRFQDASGKIFNGQITGVAEFGQLEIETETGIRYFDIKEISFVR